MKKLSFIIVILFLMPSFLGCTSDKTSYFPYLPAYENMEFTNFEESTDKEGLNHATFIVKDVPYEKFLTTYENILHENGWKTIDDKKPFSINLEKENHILIMILSSNRKDKDIEGLIYSK